ncbi:hypothetical protein J6590_034564 [Homalodisca vitripennis]|nr:hypothetical protein J6590_034564 [Homalodisca vitripennis]
MEPVISDRGTLYIYNGYVYTTSRIHNGATVYSRCRNSSCKSRATFLVEKPNEVNITIPHNHEADEVEVEILRFKAELKRRAVIDSRPPKELFDDVSQLASGHQRKLRLLLADVNERKKSLEIVPITTAHQHHCHTNKHDRSLDTTLMVGHKHAKFAPTLEQLCTQQINLAVAYISSLGNSALKALRATLYRYRQVRRPPLPKSLHEFGAILESEEWNHLGRTLMVETEHRNVVGGEQDG